jgi:FixJ family two-component response regulator
VAADDAIVYVLDDDARVREALTALLTSAGRSVVAFGSAAEYLSFSRPVGPGCLVLDVSMPGMSGLELQRELAGQDAPPIVFLTGRGDIPSAVKAIKAGAVEFLSKPFDAEELIRAVNAAIELDARARANAEELQAIRRRYATLTPRERDVLPCVVSGLLNKQTAARLGTSEITIRIHRAQIMRKMAAGSLAGLVNMAAKLGIPPPPTKR